MLGNGMMGAGIITNSVVVFGFFVWFGFFTVLIVTCFWMMQSVRGLKEKYNLLREPAVYKNGALLKIGVAGGRIHGKNSKRRDRAA